MVEALVAALSLGVDGFVACAAIGLLGKAIGQPIPFVAWFGVCDGLGLLTGHAIRLSPAWSAAWEPAMAALWMIVAALLIVARSRPLLFLLPVLLAFDNFLAGASATPAAAPLDAVLAGVASATLAAAGLMAGRAGKVALMAACGRLAGSPRA
jgi:hypothetical protein